MQNILKINIFSFDEIKRSQIFYYLAYMFMTLGKGIGLDSDTFVYKIFFIISVFLLAFKLWMDVFYWKEIFMIVSFALIVMINFFITKETTLVFSFLFIIAIKKINIKKLLKYTLMVRIATFLIVLTGHVLGVGSNVSYVMYRDGSFIIRNSLGYSHPNLLQASFFLIVLLFIFSLGRNIPFSLILILGLLNNFFYDYTSSRTGYSVILILLLVTVMIKLRIIGNKLLFIVAKYLQFILLIVTLLLSIFLNKYIWIQKLDEILSGRLTFSREQIQYVPNFFGHNFTNSGINFDNSYSMLLSMYGLILTIIFLFGFLKTIQFYKNDTNILLLFIFLSIYFFTESYYSNVVINFSLLIISKYVIFKERYDS